MNVTRFGGLVAAVLVSASACASASGGGADPSQLSNPVPGAAPVSIANVGDTVYLVEQPVRAERRQQFEEFVQQVLWPAFQQSAAARPAGQQAVPRIRLLLPVAASEDGSYRYTFLLDPLVPGESYNILNVLREAFGEQEGSRQYSVFTEMWAGDFVSRSFIVSH